jgi:RNA polymerase-binding transcription factor DksA
VNAALVLLTVARIDLSINAPWPVHTDYIWTRFRPSMQTSRYRVMLDGLWRRKVDQIVMLSMAYHEARESPRSVTGSGLESIGGARLMGRVMAEHRDLAEIEDALDRIKSGGYGTCERCADPLPANWLAETPQIRFCPACADAGRRQRRASRPVTCG